MIEFETSNEYQEFLTVNSFCLILFGAVWCGPCKRIIPILEKLSVPVGKIDIDKLSESVPNNIKSVPTILFMQNGEEIDRIIGIVSLNVIEQKLSEYEIRKS